MRYKTLLKVLATVFVFLLRLIASTGHESELERSVANFTTQISLGLLELMDEYHRRRLAAL